MANSGLPEGWESDYDGKRWLYRYTATGAVQYKWPQPGDEYPDFVDSAIDTMDPEDRLASQQMGKMRKPAEGRKTYDSRMSATGGPLGFYNNEEFGNIEFFQPDALMYMGPGAYTDISPLGGDDFEQPLPDNVAELPNASANVGVSPLASERSTPKPANASMSGRPQTEGKFIDGGFVMSAIELASTTPVGELPSTNTVSPPVISMEKPPAPLLPPNIAPDECEFPMLDGREIQSDTRRFTGFYDPVGLVAEMPTEFTCISKEESAPIELGDHRTLASIERTAAQIPDIPELCSAPVDQGKDRREEEKIYRQQIRAQQRPYGDCQYPFQPQHDVIDPLPVSYRPKEQANSVPQSPQASNPTAAGPKYQPFTPGAVIPPKRTSTNEKHPQRGSIITGSGAFEGKDLVRPSSVPPVLRAMPPVFQPSPPAKPPVVSNGLIAQHRVPILPNLNDIDQNRQPPLVLRPGVPVSNSHPLGDDTPKALPVPDEKPERVLPYPDDDHEYDLGQSLSRPLQSISHIRDHRAASFPTVHRRTNEGNGIPKSSYNPMQSDPDSPVDDQELAALQSKSNPTQSNSFRPINTPAISRVESAPATTPTSVPSTSISQEQNGACPLPSFNNRVARPKSQGPPHNGGSVSPPFLTLQKGLPPQSNLPTHQDSSPGQTDRRANKKIRRHSIGIPMAAPTSVESRTAPGESLASARALRQPASSMHLAPRADSFSSRRPSVPESVPEHPEEDQTPSELPALGPSRLSSNLAIDCQLRRHSLGMSNEVWRQRIPGNRRSPLSFQGQTLLDPVTLPHKPKPDTQTKNTRARPASAFIMGRPLPQPKANAMVVPSRNESQLTTQQSGVPQSQSDLTVADCFVNTLSGSILHPHINDRSTAELPTHINPVSVSPSAQNLSAQERSFGRRLSVGLSTKVSHSLNDPPNASQVATSPSISRQVTAPSTGRPVSMPPIPRVSTFSSTTVNMTTIPQPQKFLKLTPVPKRPEPVTEVKEKGGWLSRLFRGSKRKSVPSSSFRVLSLPQLSPVLAEPPTADTIEPIAKPKLRPETRVEYLSQERSMTPKAPVLDIKERNLQDLTLSDHQDGLQGIASVTSAEKRPEQLHVSQSIKDVSHSASTNAPNFPTGEKAAVLPMKSLARNDASGELPVSTKSINGLSQPISLIVNSVGYDILGTPTASSEGVSRTYSGHSKTQSIAISDPGIFDVGLDSMSDQASVSTMDISEAQAQPILRPQLIEVSAPALVKVSASASKTFPISADNVAEQNHGLISPLNLKKSDRTFLLESFVPVKCDPKRLEQCNNISAQPDGVLEKTPAIRNSRSVILEAELMDALLSYGKNRASSERNIEPAGGSLLPDVRFEAKPLPCVQHGLFVAPLSTPRIRSTSGSSFGPALSRPLSPASSSAGVDMGNRIDDLGATNSSPSMPLQGQENGPALPMISGCLHSLFVETTHISVGIPSHEDRAWKKSPSPDYSGGDWEGE
ncbi:hypothetical protein Cpir12675_006769 [Ceratocystis pirilliformis]|uniref:WW domain-containing protein n=1 Tax=Ceratocystis pirilliformis TaxID=259994 RepID=A0ABR3YFS5_9PEZI